jgi:hypothetical protein
MENELEIQLFCAKIKGDLLRRNVMKRILVIIVCLLWVLPVFGEKLAEFVEVNDPTVMQIADGKMYVLEKANIYVYSLKDHKLIKKFGKQGNGPGEINAGGPVIVQMQIIDNHVCVNTFSKCVRFSLDGTFVDEVRFPFIGMQVIPFADGFAISKLGMADSGVNRVGVYLFPKDLENGKELYGREYKDFRKTGKLEVVPELFMIQTSGDKLIMLDHAEGGVIKIFAKDGTPGKQVPLAIEKVKTTDTFKKELMEWAKSQPQFKLLPEALLKMVYVPDVLPVFKNFFVADNKIFIHTFHKKGNKVEFVVLDMNGTLLKKLWLEGVEKNIIMPSPYAFYQGALYYLLENEDEEVLELHAVKLGV